MRHRTLAGYDQLSRSSVELPGQPFAARRAGDDLGAVSGGRQGAHAQKEKGCEQYGGENAAYVFPHGRYLRVSGSDS